MKLPVKNMKNEDVGEIALDDAIFAAPVRKDILFRMVNWQLAKRRQGTHKTKTAGEVSGTNKKPFKQKGTGHARQGSLRSPHMRGGGVIFGPVVRSHEHDLPKQVRRLAMKCALSSKLKEGKLVILDEAVAKDVKTAVMANAMRKLGFASALIVDGDEVNEKFALSIRNLPRIEVLPQIGANVYDILRHDTLVLTRAAVEKLEARLK